MKLPAPRYLTLFLGALLIAAPVWGQAMLDRAAVAAGGSVGVAGGKKVSDGITAIFGKVDGSAKAAAKADSKKKGETEEPMLKLGTPQVVGAAKAEPARSEAPRLPAALAPKTTTSRHASAVTHPAASQYIEATVPPPPPVEPAPAVEAPATPPPPPEIVPTRELLSGITVGTSLQDVLAKLGNPSSRITMFDDGAAVEILRFQSKLSSLGSVRIVNGAVSEVTIVEN